MSLTSGTTLNGRYEIERALGDVTPFAVTYRGRDREEERDVVITEYFPRHLAERAADEDITPRPGKEEAFRQGLDYFRKEAKVLREIDHANLAREIEDFQARGTAYRVSEHRAGASLGTALGKNDGRISEQAALTVIRPVLGALHALHREGLLHGGLTPQAIYLTQSRKVLLRGFRSAQLQLARKTDRLGEVVTPGISPGEQYDAEGRQGPWTDVYAAAATFFQAVTGRALPEAREPLSEDVIDEQLAGAEGISVGIRRVLRRALAPRPRARLQSAQALREMLDDPAMAADDDEEAGESEPAGGSLFGAAPQASGTASVTGDDGEDNSETGAEAEVWGPASMAAAAAKAAQKGKEEARDRRATDRGSAAGKGGEDGADGWQEKLPVSNRVAMGGSAAVLLLLLVGAGLLFTGVLGGAESNAESSAGAGYSNLRTVGDSLFDEGRLGAARRRYEQAQQAQPDGENASHVTQRLRMIERMQQGMQEASYGRTMRRADSLKAEADQLAAEGSDEDEAETLYARASALYLTALDNRPGDSLATARMQAVESTLGGGSEDASASEEYPVCSICGNRHEPGLHSRVADMYRRQAEEAFENENYTEARRRYRSVLDNQPNDGGAEQRLEEISALVTEADREEQYENYRERADALFEQGNLSEARSEYRLALEVMPGDAAVTNRLDTIEERLARRQERQEQYQNYRSRGDVLFEDGDLAEAAESYEQALEYRSGDEYAQQRLEETQQRLATREDSLRRVRQQSNRTEGGVYVAPDEPPSIVGGREALIRNISYPDRARRREVEGNVFLRVTVAADGSVQNVEVTRGIGYGADEEAVRAVRNVEFEPGLVDGEPVAAYRTFRIPFRLQ